MKKTTVHPKMAPEDRAKQFLPFAALKGFEEALRKVEEEFEESMKQKNEPFEDN